MLVKCKEKCLYFDTLQPERLLWLVQYMLKMLTRRQSGPLITGHGNLYIYFVIYEEIFQPPKRAWNRFHGWFKVAEIQQIVSHAHRAWFHSHLDRLSGYASDSFSRRRLGEKRTYDGKRGVWGTSGPPEASVHEVVKVTYGCLRGALAPSGSTLVFSKRERCKCMICKYILLQGEST